jgi:HEAT repeat protein
MEPCIAGPVQVRLSLSDGVVEELHTYVGPLRTRNARDLGPVSAPEAAGYLMGLAARGRGSISLKAIFPAVLADSAAVWPALLGIAKDTNTRSRATRQEAMLWLSRYASAALAGRPNDLFPEEDEGGEDDLKKHAVFVASQLPRAEAVPALLEIARSNRSPVVRSSAMFWLGQTGDPRAIALFEAVLRR